MSMFESWNPVREEERLRLVRIISYIAINIFIISDKQFKEFLSP